MIEIIESHPEEMNNTSLTKQNGVGNVNYFMVLQNWLSKMDANDG